MTTSNEGYFLSLWTFFLVYLFNLILFYFLLLPQIHEISKIWRFFTQFQTFFLFDVQILMTIQWLFFNLYLCIRLPAYAIAYPYKSLKAFYPLSEQVSQAHIGISYVLS